MNSEPHKVLDLSLFRVNGKLAFRLEWNEDASLKQRLEVAKGLDKIARSQSPDFSARVHELDRAARVGWQVEQLPEGVLAAVRKWLK